MASEIRVNKINNRAGLGTVTYTDTGIIVSGISTATNFKTGSSNLHSNGLTVGDTFVHSTGIDGSSADIDDFISVGNNIHLGNAGVITATSFSGDGSSLSNLPAGAPVGGASTNTVFFENDMSVGVGYSITYGKNAMSAGPISINAGVAVTVPSGSAWTIV